MKTNRWKRFARAAGLTLCLAFAYQAAAALRAAHSSAAPRKPCKRETVLRGKGVVRFGGYELNVFFTPEGRIVCFNITAAAKDATDSKA